MIEDNTNEEQVTFSDKPDNKVNEQLGVIDVSMLSEFLNYIKSLRISNVIEVYGQAVSTYPFLWSKEYDSEHATRMIVILEEVVRVNLEFRQNLRK